MLAGFDAKPLKRASRRQVERAQAGIPTGVSLPFRGTTAPQGYLLENGAAVSRQRYAALFAVIGTTYGVGDGATTFNVPDSRDRLPIGSGNLYALGATGGSKDAIVVSHGHTVNDPPHGHGTSESPHSHTYIKPDVPGGNQIVFNTSSIGAALANTSSVTTGVSVVANSTGVSVNSSGASGTDANLPPYLGVNFIIKA